VTLDNGRVRKAIDSLHKERGEGDNEDGSMAGYRTARVWVCVNNMYDTKWRRDE
jgi:hypothetical protein